MNALDLLGDVTEEEADRLVTDYATDMGQDVVDACNALLRSRRERAQAPCEESAGPGLVEVCRCGEYQACDVCIAEHRRRRSCPAVAPSVGVQVCVDDRNAIVRLLSEAGLYGPDTAGLVDVVKKLVTDRVKDTVARRERRARAAERRRNVATMCRIYGGIDPGALEAALKRGAK